MFNKKGLEMKIVVVAIYAIIGFLVFLFLIGLFNGKIEDAFNVLRNIF